MELEKKLNLLRKPALKNIRSDYANIVAYQVI
jgi:hypothetical protein